MKLAELFVDIVGRPQSLYATLGQVQGRLTSFARAAGAMRINLFGGPMLAAGAGVAYGLLKAVNGASDLSETLSKVDVVFGKSAGTVTSYADKMAASFGLPKREILDAASNLGIVAKASGYTEAAAADLGVKMAQLAVDASSINNVPLPLALEKIRSGLVGEAEPLRAFGVLLSENAVKAEAARMKLAAVGKELTEGQKVQARAAVIAKQLAYATGDLERTQDGAANQTRKLWGQVQNLSESLGTELLPAFQNLLIDLNKFISDAARDWFGPVKQSIQGTLFVARNLGTVFQIAGVDIAIEASKITGVFDQIKDKWLFIVDTIRQNPLQLVFPQVDMAAFGKKIFGGLADAVQGKGLNANAFVPGEIGRAAAANAPVEMKDTEATKVLRELRADLENVLARRATEDAKATGAGPARKETKAEKDPAKAEKSAGLFSDIPALLKKMQEGVFGKDFERQTAENTKDIADGIRKMQNAALGRPTAAVAVAAPG